MTSEPSRLRLLPEIAWSTWPTRHYRCGWRESWTTSWSCSPPNASGLLAASVAIGLDVMSELIDDEVTEVAGPKGCHDPARAAYRHGSQNGKVTLGGRTIPVRRPRVRTFAGDDDT